MDNLAAGLRLWRTPTRWRWEIEFKSFFDGVTMKKKKKLRVPTNIGRVQVHVTAVTNWSDIMDRWFQWFGRSRLFYTVQIFESRDPFWICLERFQSIFFLCYAIKKLIIILHNSLTKLLWNSGVLKGSDVIARIEKLLLHYFRFRA